MFYNFYNYWYSKTPIIWIIWDGKPSGYAENPDKWIYLEKVYIGGLKFCCYYLQYVPTSKPFDHASFEVHEAITLHCTWSDDR